MVIYVDPLKWLELNKSFLVSSNLILELFRILGWYIIIGLKALLDECEKLYDTVYSFLDFTQYDTVQNFIKSFQPVYVSLVTLSIIALGIILIVNPKKKPKIFTGILLMVVVVSGSSLLISTLNAVATGSKDAILPSSTSQSLQIINNNLYDLVYIDKATGLENMDISKSENLEKYRYPVSGASALTQEKLSYIDAAKETINPDSSLLTTSSTQDLLSKKIVYVTDGNQVDDINSGISFLNNFGNEFYYRYKINWFPTIVSFLSVIIVFLVMSYKVIRIIYELVIHQLLAFLYSADITGSKKTLKILSSIKDNYIVLILTSVLIKVFLIFQTYISAKLGSHPITQSIILFFAAIAVCDGPNIIQQLTGVDAGLQSGVERILATTRFAQASLRNVTDHQRYRIQKGLQERAMESQKEGFQAMAQSFNTNAASPQSTKNPTENGMNNKGNGGNETGTAPYGTSGNTQDTSVPTDEAPTSSDNDPLNVAKTDGMPEMNSAQESTYVDVSEKASGTSESEQSTAYQNMEKATSGIRETYTSPDNAPMTEFESSMTPPSMDSNRSDKVKSEHSKELPVNLDQSNNTKK